MKSSVIVANVLLLTLVISPAHGDYLDNLHTEVEFTQRNALRVKENQSMAQNKQVVRVKASASPSAWSDVTVIGRGTFDHYYDKSRFESLAVRDHRAESELREGYVDIYVDNLAMRFGKQQVTWGESDYFRTLDVINPMDLRDFLLPYIEDFQEARRTLLMANFSYQGERWASQLLFIPDFQKNHLPSMAADFAPKQLVALTDQLGLPIEETPDASWDNAAWGVMSKGTFDWGDLGLFAYSGWNPEGTLSLSGTLPVLRYHRREFLGVSFSRPFGAWVLRSDTAYRFNERLSAQFNTGKAFVEHDIGEFLVGADYNHGSFSFSLQALYRHIMEHDAEVLEDQRKTSFSVYVANEFMGDRLRLSHLLLGETDHINTLNESKVSYRVTDKLTTSFGLNWFTGSSSQLYGQFRNQSRIFTSVSYFL